MAHFSVAVFSKRPQDVAKLMLPYDMRVAAGAPYALFQDHPRMKVDELTGRPGFWFNPQYRFDWWCVGGRWKGMLRVPTHDGRLLRINQARAEDCDLSCETERYKQALNHWNFYLYGTPMPNGERNPVLKYKPEYYIDRYGTAQLYAAAMSGFYTEAFVDEEGGWHSPMRLMDEGPEAPVTEIERQQYYEELKAQAKKAVAQHQFITICNCHI